MFSSISFSSNPISTRAHKKSKKGCKACKTRKVKCDEKRPLCGNCARHFVNAERCEFEDEQPPKSNCPSQNGKSPKGVQHSAGESARCLGRAISPVARSIDAAMMDPFQTHPETTVANADLLMKFYLSNVVYRNFPWQPASEMNAVTKFYVPQLWDDPLLYHSTLYLSAHRTGVSQPGQRIKSISEISQKCINLLQKRVQDSAAGISDGSIGAVATLAAIEHERENPVAVQMHLGGLKRMVSLRGGWNTVKRENPTVAIMALWSSVVGMEDDLELPAGLTSDDVRPDWLQQITQAFEFTAKLDVGFPDVESEVANIIMDINIISKQITTHLAYSTVEESLSILTYMCSALHRALTYRCTAAPGSTVANMTNLCRYAVALHVLSPWRGLQPDSSLAINVLMHKMKACLGHAVKSRSSDDLLLWLLFTGGVAAIGLPERKWFVGHLVKVVDDLGITEWDDARQRLQIAIWHQRLNATTHEQLWKEIQEKTKELDMTK